MVISMPPNGHSTANSKVSAGGSGHSHSPNPLKPSSLPCTAMRRQVQIPPVIVGQRALPGHDLHIKHAARAESPDHRQAHHHVRAAGHYLLHGDYRAGLQRGRSRPRRTLGKSPGNRLFPGRQGLEKHDLTVCRPVADRTAARYELRSRLMRRAAHQSRRYRGPRSGGAPTPLGGSRAGKTRRSRGIRAPTGSYGSRPGCLA